MANNILPIYFNIQPAYSHQVSLYKHGSTLIPVWLSNNIHFKLWEENTWPFPNFNDAGTILGMSAANERLRQIVTSPLIGWAYTQNGPWIRCV